MSVFIPTPETDVDIAASVLGALSMAEERSTINNTRHYISYARLRIIELIDRLEHKGHDATKV